MSPSRQRGGPSRRADVVVGVARLLRRRAPRRDRRSRRSRSRSRSMSKSRSSAEQRLQLLGQDLLVPAGVQRELVVGEDVGPLLGSASSSRCAGTAPSRMPSSFAAATRPWPARIMFARSISTGLVKPNRRMRLGDLPDLLLRMRPGVPRVRPERPGTQALDLVGHHGIAPIGFCANRAASLANRKIIKTPYCQSRIACIRQML